MLKRMKPFTNLGRKHYHDHEHSCRESLILRGSEERRTPEGFFVVYAGEQKERFEVPMSFLSHPLFKILLEKAHEKFGFEHNNGLVVPCSVSTFQEVVNAVESSHGRFDMTKILREFV
uniref:Small auxin-up RNA n=1 Tax=Opuntia streptacantha TaxID=393608 RepID=A0A7C8ZIR7_OPUST